MPLTFTCDKVLCSGQIVNRVGAALVIQGMALDEGSHFLKVGDEYRRFNSRKEVEAYAAELAQDAAMYRGHTIDQLPDGTWTATYEPHGVRITATSMEELHRKVDKDLTAYGKMNDRGGYIMDAAQDVGGADPKLYSKVNDIAKRLSFSRTFMRSNNNVVADVERVLALAKTDPDKFNAEAGAMINRYANTYGQDVVPLRGNMAANNASYADRIYQGRVDDAPFGTPIQADPEEIKKLYSKAVGAAGQKKDNQEANRSAAQWYGGTKVTRLDPLPDTILSKDFERGLEFGAKAAKDAPEYSASVMKRAKETGREPWSLQTNAKGGKPEEEAYNRELALRIRNTAPNGRLPPTSR